MKLALPIFCAVLPFLSAADKDVTKDGDACVTLYVYGDNKCTGPPLREITFPTMSETGSSCYHDAMMINNSAKNQYCNKDTGNWHSTYFYGSETCSSSFKQPELIFTSNGCTGGLKLKECKFESCNVMPLPVGNHKVKDESSTEALEENHHVRGGSVA